MNVIKKIISVILLAFIFAVGILAVPPINADYVTEMIVVDDNTPNLNMNANINIDTIDNSQGNIDEICPAVCIPMWVISSEVHTNVDVQEEDSKTNYNQESEIEYSCEFVECGSGCGVNNIRSFETEQECKVGIEKFIEKPKPPVTENKLGLSVKFTPVVNDNSGFIYNNSKIHARVISSKELLKEEYNLVFKMTPLVDISTSDKVVYLMVDREGGITVPTERIDSSVSVNESSEIDVSTVKAEVYTQVSSSQNLESIKNIERVRASVSASNQVNNSGSGSVSANTSVATRNQANSVLPEMRRVYTYNYQVSIKNNLDLIEKVFGKEFRDNKYSIEVSLVNRRIVDSQDPLYKTIVSENFVVAFAPIDTLSEKAQEKLQNRMIVQEQVKISNVSINAEAKKDLRKEKGDDVLIETLEDYEVFTDESMTEMYISNQEKVRKIKPINNVLIENNIKTENVIGNVELVSVDSKLEYVLKVKEQRKLFGFIPFGHREKYVSLNASEDVEITE
ncbi:hypothetical protein GW835_01415 [archaeon]|nr:hypothetical protein [archaeon]NCP79209.1 hypothetical protein [archaeon]NCP97844.1 hypothetical protein [archaeon]NCQ06976.1 hypothetical protein [archaeon]NCQ50772.1 hypothetical protein [archaeon]